MDVVYQFLAPSCCLSPSSLPAVLTELECGALFVEFVGVLVLSELVLQLGQECLVVAGERGEVLVEGGELALLDLNADLAEVLQHLHTQTERDVWGCSLYPSVCVRDGWHTHSKYPPS